MLLTSDTYLTQEKKITLINIAGFIKYATYMNKKMIFSLTLLLYVAIICYLFGIVDCKYGSEK